MNDVIIDYLANVEAVCEATRYEHHCIWKEYTNQHGRVDWRETGHGYLETVGHIDEHPVCISLLTVFIQNRKFLFYHATSRFVDHDMIRTWLVANLPSCALKSPGYLNHSDAMNFWNLVK